jgi:hypothetical protein
MISPALRLPLLCFAVTFIVVFVMQIPAGSLVRFVQTSGFSVSAERAAGTVWRGAAAGVRVAGLPAGALEFAFSPLHLSPPGPALTWTTNGSGLRSQGTAVFGLGGPAAVSDVELTAVLDRVPFQIPVSGRLDVGVTSARMEDRRCVAADGQMTVTGTIGMLDRPPVRLTGPLLCDAGRLTARLSGTIGAYLAVLDITSSGLETAHVTLALSEVSDSAGSVLRTFGFTGGGGNYELGQILRLE